MLELVPSWLLGIRERQEHRRMPRSWVGGQVAAVTQVKHAEGGPGLLCGQGMMQLRGASEMFRQRRSANRDTGLAPREDGAGDSDIWGYQPACGNAAWGWGWG